MMCGASDRLRRRRDFGINHSWGFVSALFNSQPYNDTTSGFEARAFLSADRSLLDVSVQFTQMLMLSTCARWLTISGQQQEKTMSGTPHMLITITLSVNLLYFIYIVLTQCSERLGGNIFSVNLFGDNSPGVLCVTRSIHRNALRGLVFFPLGALTLHQRHIFFTLNCTLLCNNRRCFLAP